MEIKIQLEIVIKHDQSFHDLSKKDLPVKDLFHAIRFTILNHS